MIDINKPKPPDEKIIKLIDSLVCRFVSGNAISVERTHITRSEWEVINWTLRESLKTD